MCVYVCACVCICVYVYVFVCMSVCVCMPRGFKNYSHEYVSMPIHDGVLYIYKAE